jgi:succinate dehydrogenase / fumarate reductase, cytochrome b subunit
MTDSTLGTKPKRPEFRNINAFKDLTTYRMVPAAWVSILHRASGAIMFLLMPFIIWMFDTSLSSEISFAKFTAVFKAGVGFVPGWFFKLIALALIWAFLHHFIAGVRHLFMDLNHDRATKEFGKSSAMVVLVLSLGLTFVLALKLFGAY